MGRFVFVLGQISGRAQTRMILKAHKAIIRKKWFELDARAIVDALNNQSNANSVIRQLVIQIFKSSLRHVFREANRTADCLASLGPNLEYDFVLFSSPPVDLISILEADYHGMCFNKPCPELVFALYFLWIFHFYPKKKKK